MIADLSTVSLLLYAFSLGIAYALWKCIYNLYVHPLARFPGPKIAALSYLYEQYFDIVKDGTYMWEIIKMHEKYGPIVRVNPREIHISDPEFYAEIYAGGSRKVNKDGPSVAAFAVPRASLATVDHGVHRMRRGIMGPYFSKQAIRKLEPLINERIGRLCERFGDHSLEGQIVDLDAAFAALTADIVSEYFYGTKNDFLGRKDFQFPMRDAIIGLVGFYHVTRFFPILANGIKKLPIPLVRLIQPGAADLLTSEIEIRNRILASKDSKDGPKTKSVIMEALKDPSVPAEEKEIDRLQDEGTTILFAGTETTARSLSIMLFNLLHNKNILAKLRLELATLRPRADHTYPLVELEGLPYLTGVIQEGLRHAHGPMIRLPRVVPHEALHYENFVIPPGTPVSQMPYVVHMNPKIFADPAKFDPERWIEATEQGTKLDKYIVSFTKGSRQCLGINMAYAEMYLTIARVVMSFDMELFETTVRNVESYHIRLTGYPRKGSATSVKVNVTSART